MPYNELGKKNQNMNEVAHILKFSNRVAKKKVELSSASDRKLPRPEWLIVADPKLAPFHFVVV